MRRQRLVEHDAGDEQRELEPAVDDIRQLVESLSSTEDFWRQPITK